MAADAPSWADYRALAHRVRALAEGREAAGEEPCAELMRAMQHYVDNFGLVRLPSKARRLNPPSALDRLSDDLALQLFSRAPFMTHGTLHVVCRRLKTLLRSPEFRQMRVETGLAEYGIVDAGGAARRRACRRLLDDYRRAEAAGHADERPSQ